MIRSYLMRRVALLIAAVACSAPPGFGWGEEGHRLVVRIAEGLLTPAAQAQVKATLMPGESLEDLASWADEIRQSRPETYNWHFVDIPLDSSGLDMTRDCPQGDCVIQKITDFQKGWQDPAASAASRRDALLFLVHFVGDLHQPLHCENNHDRGGNDVPVSFLGTNTNLHALWDSGLLRTMPGEDHLLTTLNQAITPEQVANWSGGTVEQWAGESFHAAQATVYGPLPAVEKGQAVPLDEWYEQMVEPVLEQQLEKAGVRLAAILNGTEP
jgi:nuclease S1